MRRNAVIGVAAAIVFAVAAIDFTSALLSFLFDAVIGAGLVYFLWKWLPAETGYGE